MLSNCGLPKCVLGLLISLATLCICSPLLVAQTASTGALTGTVTDPSGAVIVGATVVASNTSTGQTRTATTDTTGRFQFSLLQPGTYRVEFSAAGFQRSEVPSITVNVTETPVLNQKLQLGSQTQQVTVESTSQTIQTENATLGGLVGSQEVASLPLSTRNYTQIVDLSPGVATNVASATNFGEGTQDVNVNGSSSEHNNYQMEGASIVNYISGKAGQENTYGSIPIPNPDAIQEFKVQTSQYDASFGRNSGASVNVVLKTGTNSFHGEAWEFNRNNFFNANDYFNKITEGKFNEPNSPLTLKQNQFGFTFGGPIRKNKAFFFGSYQGTRQTNGVVNQGYSPGVDLPAINDYADASSGVCANVRCTNNGAAYQAFLGRVFGVGGPEAQVTTPGAPIAADGSNISPVSIAILQAAGPKGVSSLNKGFLVPGAPSSCAAPCLSNLEDPASASEDQFLINMDYHLSTNNTFSGRYMYSYLPETIPFGNTMSGSPNEQDFRSDFAVLKLVSVLTPNLVNSVQTNFNRITTKLRDLWNVQACAVGIIPSINNGAPCPAVSGASPDLYLMPIITISGLSSAGSYPVGGFAFGGGTQTSSDVATNEYQADEQLSWNHGRHSIRVGGDYERDQVNWLLPGGMTGRGGETFRTIGDFLSGAPGTLQSVSGNRSLPSGSFYAVRGNMIDSYAQDDLKLTSRLTVNLGVRWDYFGLPIGTNNGYLTGAWPVLANQVNTGSFFLNNPQGTLAGYVAQSRYPLGPPFGYGLTSPNGATGVYVNSNNSIIPNGAPKDVFSPRFGFAWQPIGSNLVIRGGYGWFHDRPLESIEAKSMASGAPRTVTYTTATLASRGISNPFPPSFQGVSCIGTGGTCPQLGWTPRTLVAPTTMAGIQPNYKQPLVQEYNLELQYSLPHGWLASVGYVGSHGTHLLTSAWDINPDYIIAGAPNTPSGLYGEIPINNLPFNDPANPGASWVTSNQGPGKSAISANQIDRARYLGLTPLNGFTFTATTADSLYNSLQASLQHQFSHGVTLDVSYTWSKLMTNLSGGLATTGAAQNENGNLIEPGMDSGYTLSAAQQYGPAAYNRPQRLVVSYLYEVPFQSQNLIAKKLLGGWSFSGVTTIQDGEPLTITDPSGGTIYGTVTGSGTSRAELANPGACGALGNCQSKVPYDTAGRIEARTNCYFAVVSANCPGVTSAAAAFSATGSEPLIGGIQSSKAGPYSAPQTVNGITSGCYGANPQYINCATYLGDSGPGVAAGPSQLNFDMSLSKSIPITERTHLEFRAEAFNIWNHTQFNAPASLAVNSANFGKITSVSVPPRVFQFGLKFFF